MNTAIEIFTQKYPADLIVNPDGINIQLTKESKSKLEEYLKLVLPHYVEMKDIELSLDQLIAIANEWQEANPNEKLSEPNIILPYWIPKETKVLLAQMAADRNMTMTQLIIEMIDQEFKEVVGEQNEN